VDAMQGHFGDSFQERATGIFHNCADEIIQINGDTIHEIFFLAAFGSLFWVYVLLKDMQQKYLL
jgi:hypothetical protein